MNGATANFTYTTANNSLASAQDPRGNTTTFTYTPSGNVSQTTTVTDLNGNATKYLYAIQLRSVTDAAGKTASFDYDTYNTPTSQTDMRGNATTYGISYDTTKTPEQILGTTTTDPLQNVTTTAYTQTNKVMSVTVPSPNTAKATVATGDAYSTDGRDNLTTVTSPAPNQVGATTVAPVTSTVSYAYFSGKNIQTNASVQWWLPSGTSDQAGSTTQLGYDSFGYLNSVTHGTQGDLVTSGYNSIGWLQGVSTHPSSVLTDTTGYTYDAWGRVTSVIAPDSTVTGTTYDPNGNVLRVEDANASDGALHGGVAWTAGYFGDALQFDGSTGWVDLGNKPDLGFTGPITISALIKPASPFASGYQDIVAHGYQTGSPQGEVALRINNGYYEIESTGAAGGEGAKWPIPSSDQGQWVNLIGTFDGTTWHLYHDGTQVATGSGTQGAVPVSVDWALGSAYSGPGLTSRYFNGTIDDVRIFNRAVTTTEVTQLNNAAAPSAVADGLLGYWRLDEGAGATTVDWCHSITNSYDADNRLSWTFNGHLDWVRYFYDADSGNSNAPQNPYQAKQHGLLSYKTDGNGHTTYYVYDADNRPIKTVRPDGTATTVTYDEDGDVKTRLDANGITATYTYDKDDRLTNVVYTKSGSAYTDGNGNSNNVTLAYNADSLLSTMTDYTGTTNWNYDNAGNALNIGGNRGTVSYTYGSNGLRQTMSEGSPAEGPLTWQYAYDDANRPESVIDPFASQTYSGTITFGYDQADRLTTKTFPNGVTTAIGYDDCDEVTGVTTSTSGGGTLTSSNYAYDLAGNLAGRTDSDGTAAKFTYNGADQLTFETYAQSGNGSSIGYTYDHNGNRTTQSNSGFVTSYAYNASDELTSDSNGGTYSYDGNGNWTQLSGSASTYTFKYDAENRLISYQAPSMASTYSCNGMGLRVAEYDSGSGQHDLINDGTSPASPLLVDHNLSAKTVAHVYTPGLEQRDGLTGALHLFGVDALGSVRALINDDGGQAATDTLSYYGYGITRTRTGSDGTPFGFAGGEGYQTDPNELMLLGNREYHPFTGRFLTRDPAGAGDNDYAYADDNPLSYVDPSGLYGEPAEPGSQNSPSAYQNPGYDSSNDMTATDWYLNEYKDGKYDGNSWLLGTTYLGNSSLDTPFTSMTAVAGPKSEHFAYAQDAARHILHIVYNLMRRQTPQEEYGGRLLRDEKGIYADYWTIGSVDAMNISVNSDTVAICHTHPDGPPGYTTDDFSGTDKATADETGTVDYLGATPDMRVYVPIGIDHDLGPI